MSLPNTNPTHSSFQGRTKVYAVLQDHEVVDYFKDRESAEAEALNQYDLGYTSSLYVVQITTSYDA